jgi:hypothetical protein
MSRISVQLHYRYEVQNSELGLHPVFKSSAPLTTWIFESRLNNALSESLKDGSHGDISKSLAYLSPAQQSPQEPWH